MERIIILKYEMSLDSNQLFCLSDGFFGVHDILLSNYPTHYSRAYELLRKGNIERGIYYLKKAKETYDFPEGFYLKHVEDFLLPTDIDAIRKELGEEEFYFFPVFNLKLWKKLGKDLHRGIKNYFSQRQEIKKQAFAKALISLISDSYGIYFCQPKRDNRGFSQLYEWIDKYYSSINLKAYLRKLKVKDSELFYFTNIIFDFDKNVFSTLSEFFRDSIDWHKMRQALSLLIDDAIKLDNRTLRIGDFGCGEEKVLYCAAVLTVDVLMEKGEDIKNWNIEFIGIDVNIQEIIFGNWAKSFSYDEDSDIYEEEKENIKQVIESGLFKCINLSEYLPSGDNTFVKPPDYLTKRFKFVYSNLLDRENIAGEFGVFDIIIYTDVLKYNLTRGGKTDEILSYLFSQLREGGHIFIYDVNYRRGEKAILKKENKAKPPPLNGRNNKGKADYP